MYRRTSSPVVNMFARPLSRFLAPRPLFQSVYYSTAEAIARPESIVPQPSHFVPAYQPSAEFVVGQQDSYWQKIPRWQHVTNEQFLSHKWQMSNTVQSEKALCEFLSTVLPETIPPQSDMEPHLRITDINTPSHFIQRLKEGIQRAPMAVRLSPHILSSINWQDPINDPVRRQFIPLSSPLNVDHPAAELDPMKENTYSPVSGLIHRYPDRALFFGKSGSDDMNG